MALLIKKSVQGCLLMFNDTSRDVRSEVLWYMPPRLPMLGIGLFYLYFVNILGPKLMKDRKPFNLDNLIKIYNLLQVLANAYIVFMGLPYFFQGSKICYPIDFSNSSDALRHLRIVYFYYVIKVVDLLDTVFFVLRKKFNQATFLHVYHHFGMVNATWAAVTFYGGGHSIFLPFLNSFVHTFMYFYYFLSSLDEKYKKNVWWKKHITHLQLVQFFLLILIYTGPLVSSSCTFPKFVSYFLVPQNIFMLILFSDFYKRTYLTPSKLEDSKEK